MKKEEEITRKLVVLYNSLWFYPVNHATWVTTPQLKKKSVFTVHACTCKVARWSSLFSLLQYLQCALQVFVEHRMVLPFLSSGRKGSTSKWNRTELSQQWNSTSARNEIQAEVQPYLQLLTNSGTTEGSAADSCKQIAQLYPNATSDYYWIRTANGSATRLYCDMLTRCGQPGWTQVAFINMSNSSQSCQVNLQRWPIMESGYVSEEPTLLVTLWTLRCQLPTITCAGTSLATKLVQLMLSVLSKKFVTIAVDIPVHPELIPLMMSMLMVLVWHMATQESMSGHLLLHLMMLWDNTPNICVLVHEVVHQEWPFLLLLEATTFVTLAIMRLVGPTVIYMVMIHSGMQQDVEELTHAAPSTLHHGSRIKSLAQLLIP